MQVVVDGESDDGREVGQSAQLLTLESGRWWLEATYD